MYKLSPYIGLNFLKNVCLPSEIFFVVTYVYIVYKYKYLY